MKKKEYHMYILTNRHHTVLYTGVSGDLVARIWQHKQKQVDGFTKRYNVDKLIYVESFRWVDDAIAREKQIKGCRRDKKEKLINELNPEWKDLYEEIL